MLLAWSKHFLGNVVQVHGSVAPPGSSVRAPGPVFAHQHVGCLTHGRDSLNCFTLKHCFAPPHSIKYSPSFEGSPFSVGDRLICVQHGWPWIRTLELLLGREAFFCPAWVPGGWGWGALGFQPCFPDCIPSLWRTRKQSRAREAGAGDVCFGREGCLALVGVDTRAAVTVTVHAQVSQLPCSFWIRALRLLLLQPPPSGRGVWALHRAVPPTVGCEWRQGSRQRLGRTLPYSCRKSGSGHVLTSVRGRDSS